MAREENPFYEAIGQISSSLRKKVFGTTSKAKPKTITKSQRAALANDGGFSKLLKAKKAIASKKKQKALGIIKRDTNINIKKNKVSSVLPKKKPASIKALGVIKKDTNIKGKGKKTFRDYTSIAAAKRAGSMYYMDKDGKKKAAVTASDLKRSGLSLRDYINFKLGKTRRGK